MWSPATNQYQYACFLQMMIDEQDANCLDTDQPSTSSGSTVNDVNENDRIDDETILDAMRYVIYLGCLILSV